MAFTPRRGPNVSEYVANLNTIPSEQDLQSHPSDFKFEDDLAMFTNANFFDFDLPQTSTASFALDTHPRVTSPTDLKSKPLGLDDFSFGDFSTFQRASEVPSLTPIDTKAPYIPTTSVSSPTSGLVSPTDVQHSNKHGADSLASSSDPVEEFARVAAEEDKRRRNTAASARFRVKKKQREQALEKSAKEMSDRVAALEGMINQLETENKWLKNLITERNAAMHSDESSQAWRRYSSGLEKDHDRIAEERKDGVGTRA